MPGKEASRSLDVDRQSAAPTPNDEVADYFRANPGDDTNGVSDIQVLRKQTRRVGLAVRGELPEIAESADRTISRVKVRTYRPTQLTRPGLGFIWIHGGGWMHGDLDVYEAVARAFANALGCQVIAVDYGLAPEHPFPAGLDDVWKVLQWANGEFEEVILAGDSSGANIAAAAAITARDNGVLIAAQLLLYPVLDSSDATEFKQNYRRRYSAFAGQEGFGESTYQRIKWIWDVYVPDPKLRKSELVSPTYAATLRGIAPAVIITAEHDILRGEAEAYADRLQSEGVPVELINFPGQIHGFFQMRGVLSDAHVALEVAVRAVDRYLDSEPARKAPLNPAPKTKES